MITPEVIKWGRAIPYTSPTGVKTTLYSTGILAHELGRTTQTIIKWEIGGIIPPTRFRINGRRFYSDEHINAVLDSAEKSHIRQGSKLSITQFSPRMYKEFARLNEYFFGKKED